jgi:DNA polymerase sigma
VPEVKIDITFDCMDESENLGVLSMNLTQHLVCCYQNLQYLTIVVKSLLVHHELNSSYHGGLSSYSLILWLVAYLNTIPGFDTKPYDELLKGFLAFFGKTFDPR